jgi:hypothetical protein
MRRIFIFGLGFALGYLGMEAHDQRERRSLPAFSG